ncbi:AzlD domain-containing protein [Streptomyces sp. Rer75]|uniref:AzlD domain-containing protein n=1 Tax=unclassified Streptomyces TaxID=2593676 RepID=UPI0015D00C9F|nr:AzlD domain-containing protein [Streptomyces sp. Rer75]QLH20360.1 AzlD domain-containing protein [Streptomyces sp. Rer75]
MPGSLTLAAAILALAAGTFALRFAGPLLRSRITLPARAEKLMETSAIVLLAAVAATTALTEGHDPAGIARPAGVVVAGVLAWRKAPFLVVVLAAAVTAAGLRLLGVA